MKAPWKNSIRLFAIVLVLSSETNNAHGQKALRGKYQLWAEDDGRIEVKSWYFEGETALGEWWKMDVTALVDTITGATPIGRPPTDNPDDWLARLEEERKAWVIQLGRHGMEYDFSFEFGLSDEPDYYSRSLAVSGTKGIWEDTLNLNLGLSYMDDRIDTSVPGGPGYGIRSKYTPEVFFGVERLLDDKSSVSLNFTYGKPNGYLGDPYKQIGQTITLFHGDPVRERQLMFLFPENRPEERDTFVAFLEGKRLFDELDASIQGSYRYFADNQGLAGHTFDLQWFQRFAESFVLRPFARYYIQDAADYYHISLDSTGITPSNQPSSTDPHYSSDYRISELETMSYGIKLTYFTKHNLSLDFAYDRYLMDGKDGVTDQRLYPDADVFTIGIQSVY